MRDTMGIIIVNDEKIAPITNTRVVAALPFAGRYRLIDFVLSSMTNAGVGNVALVTKSNCLSLLDHIKSGKPWDLDRKREGLNVLPPNLGRADYGIFSGDIDMLSGIKNYIRRSEQDYVILSLGDFIYNIDFNEVFFDYMKNESDITVVYKDIKEAENEELSRFTILDIDEKGRVTDLEENPYYPKSTNVSMDLYIMKKAILEKIIDECEAKGKHDFVKNALEENIGKLKISGYKFSGFCEKIDSLKAYYNSNMSFLKNDVREQVFHSKMPVFTKIKDQSPTRCGNNADIKNSFISDGCFIDGKVENSILFRGARIEAGAYVKNSIIMQNAHIEKGAVLDCVIFDKKVSVGEGRRLIGHEKYPLAIAKGAVI